MQASSDCMLIASPKEMQASSDCMLIACSPKEMQASSDCMLIACSPKEMQASSATDDPDCAAPSPPHEIQAAKRFLIASDGI
jgi:hypothetical protein